MAMTLLTTNTGSGVSNSAFTSSIDSTYKLYIIKWYDMHPSEDDASFQFNGSIDSGSNYNVTKTTTYFAAQANEGDGGENLGYDTPRDIAQGTGYQIINYKVDGESNDGSSAGELFLFNPSSTTYVKHFYWTSQYMYPAAATYSINTFGGGYFNTTDDIDAINFQMDSGTFNAVIRLYGVG